MGRLLTIDYGVGAASVTPKVTFSYDNAGNRSLMSENNGTSDIRKTNYAYDDLHRLASVGFDNDGNGTVDETVSYEYDNGGLRTKLTLPGSLLESSNNSTHSDYRARLAPCPCCTKSHVNTICSQENWWTTGHGSRNNGITSLIFPANC
ncbi:MAG: hypothetical protein R3E39_26325 [Anaerolineae bacterium]